MQVGEELLQSEGLVCSPRGRMRYDRFRFSADQGTTTVETRLPMLEELAREAGGDWPLVARLAHPVALAVRGQLALEVGAGPGVVTVWLADAMEQTGGRLVVLEQDPIVIESVTGRLEDLGLMERVQLLQGDAHRTIHTVAGPFDLVRLAADRSGYLDYYRAVRDRLRPGAVILAEGLAKEAARPFRETVRAEIDLRTVELPMRGQSLIGVWWPSRGRE